LDDKTIVEMNKHNLIKREDIIENITRIEKTIIELSYKEEKPRVDSVIIKDYNNVNPNKRYCSYHKTNSHSSEQCFKLKNIKKQNDKEKNKLNMLVKEPELGVKLIEVEGSLNNKQIKCVIDSGSAGTYSSKKIAVANDFKRKPTLKRIVQFANSERQEINEEVDCELKLNDLPNKYCLKALVLENCPSDMIIGSDFLTREDAIINYKNKL
jgi:hypothetical protein